MTEPAPVTAQQIDAILPYLATFEEAGFQFGKLHTPEGQFPWYESCAEVDAFFQCLYDKNWVVPSFDWGAWQDQAVQFVESPERLDAADAETVRKLLTLHACKDKFCDGHLASMFENGHIVALLQRLRGIRVGMGV